ncbi:8-oxo-dGTP diphosphatase MutT [Parahalioglobus pacificus]|uniref:8-oxo-dGTP diphosphatase n=1 Tax=Parahalioglobus pacificus TaxID=930806 RepID=A0A918XDP6_9GAMM|nr:8-oxo-dGTP diphosphatase MutT [Halioglobus pacificus]GHD26024.1 hypothetical protein GCM10007053_02490 [Halioglobus pacificus]
MKRVHVAVGVIVNEQGQVLLTRRHNDAHQGGLWEFPGGKVEAGESVVDALARELAEELGISVLASRPLIEVSHDYGDKHVLLDVYLIEKFGGSPAGMEGQPMVWAPVTDLDGYEFPAANVPIVDSVVSTLA